MVRGSTILFSLMIGLTVIVGACVKEGADSPDKGKGEKPEQHSGAETGNAGIIDFIKRQKLVNFSSTTIGNAFDSYKYAATKEWKATFLKGSYTAVDYIGWSDLSSLNDSDRSNGITGRGFNVTFVIQPDGAFYVYMVSSIESRSDGKLYRTQQYDAAGVLADIYANRKIKS